MTVTIFDEIAQWVYSLQSNDLEVTRSDIEDKQLQLLQFLDLSKKSIEILSQHGLFLITRMICFNHLGEEVLYKQIAKDENHKQVGEILDKYLTFRKQKVLI